MKSGLDIIHFGKDAMPRLSELLGTDIETKEWTALSMDWKSFDATVPNFVIDEVFKMLKECIAFDLMKDGDNIHCTSDAAAKRLMKVFDYLHWNFKNTKIMLPDGRLVRKRSGIPSGSYFTSLVGSLANAIICNYLMNVMDMKIQKQHYLGDDSLIFLSNR